MQIVLVVAAVLVFSYFDPFGFLTPKKKTLKNTPVQVRSIKEIGQLITAEYYGEVIASLDEVVKVKQDSMIVEFVTITDDLHEDFLNAIVLLSKDTISKNKDEIYNHFASANPDLIEQLEFESYLYFIYEKIKNRTYKEKDLNKRLDESSKRTLIKRLYLNSRKWRDDLMTIKTDQFKSVRENSLKSKDEKKYRRSRLVIIGRGGVKAGFDFGEFDEKNFRYHPSRNTIHFIGLYPQILSATINPWFIPEERVEGFEFLIAERGARLRPEYTKLVKQRCLDKLRFQAEEKDILERAKDNAETNLKGFFSLLLAQDVKSVTFHTDQLDYTLVAVKEDSVISNEESVTIEHTMRDYFRANLNKDGFFEKMSAFVDSLTVPGLDFEIYNKKYPLHAYSTLLFHIVRNRMIDSADLVRIAERDRNQYLDTTWHSKLFVDLNLKTKLDSAKFQERLQGSIEVDLAQFFVDLENLCKDLEVEVDSAYFMDNDIKTVEFRKESLDVFKCLMRRKVNLN